MRILTGLLIVLSFSTSDAVSAACSPRETRQSGSCEPDYSPGTWALSATKDWAVWTCRYAGGGLVDNFSHHTRVFIGPAGDDGGEFLSILARAWSVAPADDVLWYVDEAGTVRRLLFSEVGESLTAKVKPPSPALDLSYAKPWPIFALSSSAAVVALRDDEGPQSVCAIMNGDGGTEIVECVPSTTKLRWTEGSSVSAKAFVVANRLEDWSSYSIDYWQIGPLARRWKRELPIGVAPRGILAGGDGDFLVVGCANEAPNPPFLAVFDSEGTMEIVESMSESCIFGLFNPCPAVVGGTWKDGKWKVWLEPGPSGSDVDELLEELLVNSSSAVCFPEAGTKSAQPADSKTQ